MKLESQNLEDATATLTSYIRRHDNDLTKCILTCRLVSKLWNVAVMKCYEQPIMTGIVPLIKDINQRRTVTKPFLGNEICFTFRMDPDKINRFRDMFKEIHSKGAVQSNPFLGRHVRFDVLLSDRINDKEFVDEITETLKLFGKHIWYVTLVFVISMGNVAHVVEAYLTLVKWLQSMPNLKYLCLQLNAHEARKIIPRFISQSPVPTLKQLLVLEVHLLTGPILEHLFAKNSHIPYFRINSNQDFDKSISGTLDNLKGVGVRYTGQNRLNLIKYVGRQCKLEMLHLHEQYENFDVPRTFYLMNKYWSETLTDITLDIMNPKDVAKLVQDSKLWQLNLPRLQRLSIRIFSLYFLDFILPLQNLKTLEVMTISTDHVDFYEKYKEMIMLEQNIEFVGFEKKLNESNIWAKLEKLENVKVTFGGHYGDPITYFEYNKRHKIPKM